MNKKLYIIVLAIVLVAFVFVGVTTIGNRVEVRHTTLENDAWKTVTISSGYSWEGTVDIGDHITITAEGILPKKVCWGIHGSEIIPPGQSKKGVIEKDFYVVPIRVLSIFWKSCK